jgi:secreted trypsin-like serine protease
VECGGSIYKPDVVLTAAHCCVDFRRRIQTDGNIIATDFTVYVGAVDLHNRNGFEQERNFTFEIHEKYRKGIDKDYSVTNDICLLFLDEKLTLGCGVETIQLATKHPSKHDNCSITGWGEKETGKRAYQLQLGELPVHSPKKCQKALANFNPTNMVCAGKGVSL